MCSVIQKATHPWLASGSSGTYTAAADGSPCRATDRHDGAHDMLAEGTPHNWTNIKIDCPTNTQTRAYKQATLTYLRKGGDETHRQWNTCRGIRPPRRRTTYDENNVDNKLCDFRNSNISNLFLNTQEVRCPNASSGHRGGRMLGPPAVLEVFRQLEENTTSEPEAFCGTQHVLKSAVPQKQQFLEHDVF